MAENPPSPEALKAAFDAAPRHTVGLEEELMLLDPDTLELAPRAKDVLAAFDGDPRFKPELPASQIEILTHPAATITEAAAALYTARRELAHRLDGRLLLAGAGVCPLGSGVGVLTALPRYERTLSEYGPIARRQLVCALQVHISLGTSDGTLEVYNAARSYLPWVAALAANGAFYEGRDTGLASVRPKLAELLPRQGVPPVLASWEDYAEALRWGYETEAFPDSSSWWWELRLHPRWGTLEFRVPDTQTTVGEAAAVAALTQALVVWLGERHAAGERLSVAPTWRIEENRWSACRYGVEGSMVDLETGARRPTRAGLEDLLEHLDPVAERLGTGAALERAGAMVEANGAIAQRQAAEAGGAAAVARRLTERFLEAWPG